MRVLTLREPWASLIAEGVKQIETRSWLTNYRGELYIHAGLSKIPKSNERMNQLSSMLKGSLHYGTIFAKCNLTDCIPIDEIFAEKVKRDNLNNFLCGDYTPGRYAWILSDVQFVTPITTKGQLSIWNYSIS